MLKCVEIYISGSPEFLSRCKSIPNQTHHRFGKIPRSNLRLAVEIAVVLIEKKLEIESWERVTGRSRMWSIFYAGIWTVFSHSVDLLNPRIHIKNVRKYSGKTEEWGSHLHNNSNVKKKYVGISWVVWTMFRVFFL